MVWDFCKFCRSVIFQHLNGSCVELDVIQVSIRCKCEVRWEICACDFLDHECVFESGARHVHVVVAVIRCTACKNDDCT